MRFSSGALNCQQIRDEIARVFSGKAKGRHVGMARGEPPPQAVGKGIEVYPFVEPAKLWCAYVGAFPAAADGVALRTEPRGNCLTPFDARIGLVLSPPIGNRERKDDCAR